MTGRISLVEQKRIQWANEREEMARLGGTWGILKNNINIRTTNRGYLTSGRMSLAETKDKQAPSKLFRAGGHYGSTVSLKSLATESSGNGSTNLKCVDCNGGSLINLHEQPELSQIRHRSPSLPPIYNKDQQQYLSQVCLHETPAQDIPVELALEILPSFKYRDCREKQFATSVEYGQQRDFAVEGLRYQKEKSQQSHHRFYDRHENSRNNYGSQVEEREGETSGYASDSVDVPVSATGTQVGGCKAPEVEMIEKTWQNPYYTRSESLLPPSRRLSDGRIGELNRPRWGSVWGQETVRGDPPPPSWLSRLGHSSQVLVINHESTSSSDSSTVGSTGSDNNKTYLRGQNIPVDDSILQEREAKRQKALELQSAIKKQLEDKDRQRKEEKERRLREDRFEEERIKREREKERERFEEEQRRLKERENAKFRQIETMREVLEAAERLAKEQKKSRNSHRKHEETCEENAITSSKNYESNISGTSRFDKNCSNGSSQNIISNNDALNLNTEKEVLNKGFNNSDKEIPKILEKSEQNEKDIKSVQVPISKDVAIVLSGRLEDSELLNKANLQLVNLVLTPTPRRFDNNSTNLSVGVHTIIHNSAGSGFLSNSSKMPSTIVENRLLTPNKYRITSGRDFGTQTDIENDLQDIEERMPEIKEVSMKDRKDATNASKRDIENIIDLRVKIVCVIIRSNFGPMGEISVKALPRSKVQSRTRIESRPQWNANRPGTRYRTQSEKDPHYQRRLRMRRRQVESSDERSRSPSPDRRKLINLKPISRTISKHRVKLDSYDADLSMDSLNSVVQLRNDKKGSVIIEDKTGRNKTQTGNNRISEIDNVKQSETENSNIWCGQEILSKLSTLKNGLLMKQLEWDSERCLVSPAASEIY
ncbi:uncharacterized protein LOC143179664 [Calliopsis andreniformis]|uniref:uncharacterized protein LOC143179664 n=1 Tax=Calliopsis andreniformis TaxID=337506 RepID=UPI003FCC6FAA